MGMICNFLTSIASAESPTQKNWKGLLIWAAKTMPCLTEQSQKDLIGMLNAVNEVGEQQISEQIHHIRELLAAGTHPRLIVKA